MKMTSMNIKYISYKDLKRFKIYEMEDNKIEQKN